MCFSSSVFFPLTCSLSSGWLAVLLTFGPLLLQRQQKIQRDRLMSDFSAALNNLQAVQRRAAEKEKETVARARGGSRLAVSSTPAVPPSGCGTDLTRFSSSG